MPPPAVAFRPIQPEDQEFLCRLYASTRREELAPVPWSEEEKAAFLRMQFEAQHRHYQEHYPGARFDLVLADGEPIGRLYVEEWPSQIRLIDIALLPEQRNRGLGSRLLRDLMAEAERAGKPLTIHVEKFNPALRLYRRLGFRSIEDKGVYELMEWRPPAG
jgi:ribosomal protein S18 acetylase RimI-like enzyme